MKFDWKAIARLGTAVVAGATGHGELVNAEAAVENAVDASAAHKPVEEQVDVYAALAVQVIETAEGFSGKELVDDASVQLLIRGVHDALHALAVGLAAKKGAAAFAPALAAQLGVLHGSTGE
jgi:hypothetical protein